MQTYFCRLCGSPMNLYRQETKDYSAITGEKRYYHTYVCPRYETRRILGLFKVGNKHDAFHDIWSYNGCEGINLFDKYGNKVGSEW